MLFHKDSPICSPAQCLDAHASGARKEIQDLSAHDLLAKNIE